MARSASAVGKWRRKNENASSIVAVSQEEEVLKAGGF